MTPIGALRRALPAAAAAAAVWAVVAGGHLLFIATSAAYVGVAAVGVALVVAHVGRATLGHAAFVGLGGYGVAVLTVDGGVPLTLAVPAGVLLAAAYGAVTGPLALRTDGIGFVMITLAFGQLVHAAATQLVWLTGGDTGIASVASLPWAGSPRAAFVIALVVLSAVAAGAVGWTRTVAGRAVDAARQDEAKAHALGYDVHRLRTATFVASAAVCGLAGALLAAHTGFVSPADLSWVASGELLTMVLLGGGQHVAGAVVGAVTLVVAEDVIGSRTDAWSIWLGALLVVVVRSNLLRRRPPRPSAAPVGPPRRLDLGGEP